MTMMWPLPGEGQLLDVAARAAPLTGFVSDAARDGLPAPELERGLWQSLLQLGDDLQATYFALAGDGDCGETLQLADGRVVKRWAERHGRPYRSIFGDGGRPGDDDVDPGRGGGRRRSHAAGAAGDGRANRGVEAVHWFHDPGGEMALKWMKLLVLGLSSGMGAGVIRWRQHLAEQSDLPAATRTRLAAIHGYFDRHRDRITTIDTSPPATPSPPARSKGPAATSSRTGWNEPGCTGLSPAPKPG